MRMQSGKVLSLLTVGLVCFALRAAATQIFIPISNIVQNAGFETGDFSHWAFGGNTTGGGHAVARNHGAFGVEPDAAHSGNFGVSADPTGGVGFLRQDLPTVVGASYELSFWLAVNQSGALSASSDHPVEFEVFWNGSLIFQTFSPPTSYTQFTFTDLIATRPSTDLKFGFRDDNGVFHFDDVVAGISAQVPEVFSTLWLALPLAMLAFARFRAAKN